MKKFLTVLVLVVFSMLAMAQVSKNINVSTAGTLSTLLTTTEKTTVTNLTITGSIDARDMKCMRDEMTKLAVLDMNSVNIKAYLGSGGTYTSTTYPDNEIPEYSFYSSGYLSGKSTLIIVTFPNSITKIGTSAFQSCSNLSMITFGNSLNSIGDNAFSNCKGLSSLTIPNTVINIGNGAFYSCIGLAGSLNFPNSVISIGSSAFFGCNGLTNIFISGSVSSIGNNAFSSATVSKLSGFNVDSGNINYSSINGVLFNKNQTILIQYPLAINGAYSIPNSVTKIGNSAFYNCMGLSGITIPNSVTSIDYSAFQYCSSLIDLVIPNSVNSIGHNAFHGCAGLTNLVISSSITAIEDYTFNGCRGITDLTIPNSVISIGKGAFESCDGLNIITIGNSVSTIGDYAFNTCFKLNKTINSLNTTPPVLGLNCFCTSVGAVSVVYVPSSAVNTYKTTSGWRDLFLSVIMAINTYNINVQFSSNGVVKENNISLINNSLISVNKGDTKTFTLIPDAGYEVATLTSGGVDVKSELINNQFTTPVVNSNATLVVGFPQIRR